MQLTRSGGRGREARLAYVTERSIAIASNLIQSRGTAVV